MLEKPFFLLFLFLEYGSLSEEVQVKVDSNGYVLYCPCMGRFGNQADQFLGAVSFAKGLKKTLVLPPWVTYPSNQPFKSLQIQFDRWFKVEPLSRYINVITMENFMKYFASEVWPVGKRMGFCYAFRDGKKCAMKEGNPFGPFWDNFNVSFSLYKEHFPLLWHTEDNLAEREKWLKRFPPNEYPVLAFQGAPGDFPSSQANQHIQQFIEFSDYLDNEAEKYMRDVMKNKPFIGIHLRNGIDFTRVCDDLGTGKYDRIFSSVQCTGHNNEYKLTESMCNPSKQDILSKIKEVGKKIKAEALFIATDHDPLLKFLQDNTELAVYHRENVNEVDDPLIDIALLSKSDFFIGNCVSSFSAFVRRQRETRNLPFDFFGINFTKKNFVKNEL